MIAASDPQEFVPSGRQQASRLPGPQSEGSTQDDFLLDKLQKVSLKDKKESEWWILRKVPNKHTVPCSYEETSEPDSNNEMLSESSKSQNRSDGFRTKTEMAYVEDELYVKGHSVIWSQGVFNENLDSDNARKVVCAYTLPLQVKHALWCTFYREHKTFESDALPSSQHPTSDIKQSVEVPAVCIIDSHNIRVFTRKGEDFVNAVPFQIGKVWTTKFGIFIENDFENYTPSYYDNCKVTLYSLAYPLDEVCPVAMVIGSQVPQAFNNPNLKVVYTSEDPSICVIYDVVLKQHSVFRIRKVTSGENLDLKHRMDTTCPSTTGNVSNKHKSRLSLGDCLNLKSSGYLPISSSNSRPGSVAGFHNTRHSKSHGSMAAASRCQSPLGFSTSSSPWLNRTSRLSPSVNCAGENRMGSCSFLDYSKLMTYLHAMPAICLEHLWTEPQTVTVENITACASKVFLCDDLSGQWYLCYVLSAKFQLSMVEVDFSCPEAIRFGSVHCINAKDAVPIPSTHMLAILEHNGNVTLYSGLNLVGKLHLGGTLVSHTPSPYIRRQLSKFNSPFPRRSSLLPHCKSSDLKFEGHMLSPVLPESSTGNVKSNMIHVNFHLEADNLPKAVLNGLRDPVENRITLRYSDGTYYRIELPPLASHPLIERCVIALKQCLTRDLTSVILTRWYACRNALGAQDMSDEQEWNLFQNLLMELLGYEEDTKSSDIPVTPSSCPKKPKSNGGTDDDWLYLVNSTSYNTTNITSFYGLKFPKQQTQASPLSSFLKINQSSILFPHIRLIHYTFHLLYEDLKLNTLKWDELKLLAGLQSKLSRDLHLTEYCVHYWKDFPTEHAKFEPDCVISDIPLLIQITTPPDLMDFIGRLIEGRSEDATYPYVRCVNTRSRDVVQICGAILGRDSSLIAVVEMGQSVRFLNPEREVNPVALMAKKGISVRMLDTLPPAIYLLFYSTLWRCRQSPPNDLPSDAYYLLWRDDLVAQSVKNKNDESFIFDESLSLKPSLQIMKQPEGELDGMEDIIDNRILKMRFPDDVRVSEARKMLQSSKPVLIVLVQRPDVSDHDFIEEQEKHLYALCIRTMALSAGRGMMTLRTSSPVITEPLQTPQLCLTGKAPPIGTTVELNHIDTPANMNTWPIFHNGVANGLRITPESLNIDNTWITFNRPKDSQMHEMEHAGFLMALGLNGHLKNLDLLNTYDYLSQLNSMTSIGILLGLSSAFRATAHPAVIRTLSIHVEALLPPTSMELDVHHNVQVAALMGIGLVYQGTSHRHIIEVLLSEIGRPPGPEMENSVDRESYSLTAGLALGLVTLKQGSCSSGLSDLNVPDTLHYYMVGGNRRPLTGSQKEKYRVSSFQIREGSSVNLDVTSPGATLALGLMYLGSGDKAVADWMAPPQTQYLLDFVRPDFLMFRILARALIMWDQIEPSIDWVENQVPSNIRPYCMQKPVPRSNIDYEAMNQAYCNIVTGACFALGLRYAGSADPSAFATLLHFCHTFTNLILKSIADISGKPTIETCLNVLLLSASMVMAGTGNLEMMRLVRLLRRRVGVASSAIVTYGSHLALHMSLGLLFLGGGRYTLSNSPANVAALICAFYPKFPTHSNDNRYHLQALRHLYVLAVEPRLVIPKDVHSMEIRYANLRLVKIGGEVVDVRGPAIVPDLSGLKSLAVEDERYWPVVFQRGQNWDLLEKILASDGYIEVKQKAGCLDYIVDKFGYHSQLAKILTHSKAVPWDPPPSSIMTFTSDQSVKHFCDHHLLFSKHKHYAPAEIKTRQMMTRVTYDAVVKDKLIVTPVFSFLTKTIQEMETNPSGVAFAQVTLIVNQILTMSLSSNLITNEALLSLKHQIEDTLEKWTMKDLLKCYLSGGDLSCCDSSDIVKLALFVRFYSLSYKSSDFEGDLLEVLLKTRNKFPVAVVNTIVNLLK